MVEAQGLDIAQEHGTPHSSSGGAPASGSAASYLRRSWPALKADAVAHTLGRPGDPASLSHPPMPALYTSPQTAGAPQQALSTPSMQMKLPQSPVVQPNGALSAAAPPEVARPMQPGSFSTMQPPLAPSPPPFTTNAPAQWPLQQRAVTPLTQYSPAGLKWPAKLSPTTANPGLGSFPHPLPGLPSPASALQPGRPAAFLTTNAQPARRSRRRGLRLHGFASGPVGEHDSGSSSDSGADSGDQLPTKYKAGAWHFPGLAATASYHKLKTLGACHQYTVSG